MSGTLRACPRKGCHRVVPVLEHVTVSEGLEVTFVGHVCRECMDELRTRALTDLGMTVQVDATRRLG